MDFNSHAHVERDIYICVFGKKAYNFNSHAHVERDSVTIKSFQNNDYFNSHAHVERDHLTKYFYSLLRISTHTLTWSVTV